MPGGDRLEREINEILEHVGDALPPEPRQAAPLESPVRNAARAVSDWERARVRELSRVSPVSMLLLAFVLMCGGFLLDQLMPYEGYWLTFAGALLFVPAFALIVFRRDHRGEPKQSRGRRPRSRR
jgi:hypothetical protein